MILICLVIVVFVTKRRKIIASQMQSQLLHHTLELEVIAQLRFQRLQRGLWLSLQTLQDIKCVLQITSIH